jgi:NAD(P)-dependent dehydrogenase (short-subunit alcohol dehydrogenase family)
MKMEKRQVALITGAGGYIGGECAVTLAREGKKIAVCDINEAGIAATVARIKEFGGEAKGYLIDVTDPADVDRVVSEVVRDFGRLDISIHVAGGSARIAGKDAKYLPLIEQDPAVIDHVLQVNLYGAFWVSRAAGKVMVAQGEGGRIINFSSIIAFNGFPSCTDYAAAKGGVVSMTKALAKEMGAHGITVNSVAPGLVHRPNEPDSDHYVKSNFLGKKCLGEDVANLVSFLTSEKAGFITGQTYIIDGGRSLAMKGND